MKKIILIVLATLLGIFLILIAGLFATGNLSVHTNDRTEPTIEVVDTKEAVITYDGTQQDLTVTPSEITVIDFNATWCGPCKKFAPIFHAVAEKYQGKAKFYSVDVDNNPDLADYFDANAIPKVVVLFPDGTKHENIGFMTAEELEEMIR